MTTIRRCIEVDISRQVLLLKLADKVERRYTVSTAKQGAGELQNSGCTPRGRHRIAEKIGAGCQENTVFVGRVPSGEIYQPGMCEQYPQRDWILTRILWLAGEEPGVNQGGDVDTYQRYIYLHGAPDEVAMGVPGSGGCVRMRNRDVIELFDRVTENTPVWLYA